MYTINRKKDVIHKTKILRQGEMQNAISRLKANKSPGLDGFPSEWYRNFTSELTPILLQTCNIVLLEGGIQPSWREAIISVIPKEGKDTRRKTSLLPLH